MRTLLHLSDLHFGAVDERTLEPLLRAAHALAPDLIVVSGDLTQRAKPWQYRQAREFLDALVPPSAGRPKLLCVPGNHDVPLHNVAARFFAPLAGYRRWISADPEPTFLDDELALVALNSARSLTIQEGRLNPRQTARLVRFFCASPPAATRVLVSHHPFNLPPGCEKRRIAGGAGHALAAMAECRGDVVLSGHLHTAHVSCLLTERSAAGPDWSVLLVQAGTATSTRQRGEDASFNLIRIEPGRIAVDRHAWSGPRADFALTASTSFARGPTGWSEVRAEA